MLLTDRLLLNYKRCRRRAFLDVYGDSTQKEPPSDFLLKLQQDSYTHKKIILANVDYRIPVYDKVADGQGGATATLALMQQGVDCIARGVLQKKTSEGITLLAFPDLLVKQPGLSNFGEWMYVPTTIKLGKRPKPEYQLIAAFRAQLLADTQGVWPPTAPLILRRPTPYEVDLQKWVPLMQELLWECSQMLQHYEEPEVFISNQKCGLCQWYSSCYAIAQHQQHISLLPGMTPNRYRDLQELGITTVEALAAMPVSTLEPLVGSEIASRLVQQAHSTLLNRAFVRHPINNSTPFSIAPASWNSCQTNGSSTQTAISSSSHILPTAPVELYFDIEAQPELNVDFLLGILVINRQHPHQTFHALLAEYPQEEALIWQQFLALVERYPQAPIFHFAEYEVEAIKRLARLYNTPQSQLEPLLCRFVDIHQYVMNTVTLPVESYSLKNLARWIGFEWRDAQMNGSKCVCLYEQWLAQGDRQALEAIVRYNEDDCYATYHLKNWLVEFLQNVSV